MNHGLGWVTALDGEPTYHVLHHEDETRSSIAAPGVAVPDKPGLSTPKTLDPRALGA